MRNEPVVLFSSTESRFSINGLLFTSEALFGKEATFAAPATEQVQHSRAASHGVHNSDSTISALSQTASPAALTAVGSGTNWSDPATWGGAVSGNNAAVIIPTGKTVVLDVNTSSLKSLMIEGTLVFAEKDLSLTSGWIMVQGGTLEIGTEAQPFAHNVARNEGAAGFFDGGGTVAPGYIFFYTC